MCIVCAGIHPTTISDSFQAAAAQAIQVLTDMSTPVTLADRESLLKSATTSLCSKVCVHVTAICVPSEQYACAVNLEIFVVFCSQWQLRKLLLENACVLLTLTWYGVVSTKSFLHKNFIQKFCNMKFVIQMFHNVKISRSIVLQ